MRERECVGVEVREVCVVLVERERKVKREEKERGKERVGKEMCVELVDLLTFWTVLSGSRAMSGTPASSIRENRFRIRFADLHTHTHTHSENHVGYLGQWTLTLLSSV